MVSMKFNRFEYSRAGYAQVMNSAGCQAIVNQKASSVKNIADSMSISTRHMGGYTGIPEHEVKTYQGKLTTGRVVRTKSDRARYAQAIDKTLTKALNSAR